MEVKVEKETTTVLSRDAEMQQLEAELAMLDVNEFPVSHKILKTKLDDAREKIVTDPDYLTVDAYSPVRLCKRVVIPTAKHPNFNFVGKIIGPGGSKLKELAASNKCRINVCGKGTTKNRAREEELLASGDPKYAHYADETQHVKVETIGGAIVAYQRMASVLEQLGVILQPVHSDQQENPAAAGGMQAQQPAYGQQPGGGYNGLAAPQARGRGRGMARGSPRGGRGGYAPPTAAPPMRPPPPQPAQPQYQSYDYSGGYGSTDQYATGGYEEYADPNATDGYAYDAYGQPAAYAQPPQPAPVPRNMAPSAYGAPRPPAKRPAPVDPSMGYQQAAARPRMPMRGRGMAAPAAPAQPTYADYGFQQQGY